MGWLEDGSHRGRQDRPERRWDCLRGTPRILRVRREIGYCTWRVPERWRCYRRRLCRMAVHRRRRKQSTASHTPRSCGTRGSACHRPAGGPAPSCRFRSAWPRTADLESRARAGSCRQLPTWRRRRSTWRATADRQTSDARAGNRRRRSDPSWRWRRSRWNCRCSCRTRTSPTYTALRETPDRTIQQKQHVYTARGSK